VAKLVKVYCHLRDKENERLMVDNDDDIEYLAQLSDDDGNDGLRMTN